MAGPYTAFTSGSQKESPAYVSGQMIQAIGPMYSSGNLGPVPVGDDLQAGTLGSAYVESVSAQGGYSPYAYAITAGALPDGLSLNSSTGDISGTPTTADIFTFTVTVTDSHGSFGTHEFNIAVLAPSSGGNSGFIR